MKQDAVELAVLGAIWGASFLFMRIAVGDFGPFALVEVRLALGAAILLPFLWRERAHFTARHWPRLAGIALLNSAIPFTLFAWGAERAPAGIGAITNAMTVAFTALVGFVVYAERLSPRAVGGLIVGFTGVVILASSKVAGASVLPAALAGTLASLCYGFGINFVRRYLADLPAAATASATLLCSSLWVAPLAIGTWPQQAIGARSWISAALLGIVCSGIAFVLYYRLIRHLGPARASTVTYLIPLFGVVWAWIVLGEQPTWNMVIAGVLILGGVALAQGAKKANG
ncbi:MAG: DMT family transporter [Steroidobacteraceae bacterium]